jgi:pimeloyl-ACP methyl ester carboxylesterase
VRLWSGPYHPPVLARIHADSGSNRPPLVYVPGIDGTGELLLGTAARLEEHFRLIRLSYETEGGEGPLVGDGYAELAASIAKCLEEVGVERPVVLAESFGVAVALRLGLDFPDRVAALGLVNGFAHYTRRFRLALSTLTVRLVPKPIYRLGRRIGAPTALFGPRRDRAAEKRFLTLSGNPFDRGFVRRMHMIGRVDLRSSLPEIALPVAIFASECDRVVSSIRSARVMMKGLPDATVETLPRSGHVVLPFADEPWTERMLALSERAGISPSRPPGSA